MPVLKDIPVARPHAPEARMRISEPPRRCRSEALDQCRHDVSIPVPPEAGGAEGARRRLNLPFRPRQAMDGQVPQQRSANGPGRRRLQLPLPASARPGPASDRRPDAAAVARASCGPRDAGARGSAPPTDPEWTDDPSRHAVIVKPPASTLLIENRQVYGSFRSLARSRSRREAGLCQADGTPFCHDPVSWKMRCRPVT